MRLSIISDTKQLEGLSFSSGDLRRIFNLAQRIVPYWRDQQLLVPEIADTRGRGFRRRYSFRDAVLCGVIQRLLKFGWKHAEIRSVVQAVRRQLREIFPNAHPIHLAVIIQIGDSASGICADVGIVPVTEVSKSIDARGNFMFVDSETGYLTSPEYPTKAILVLPLHTIVSNIMRYVSR